MLILWMFLFYYNVCVTIFCQMYHDANAFVIILQLEYKKKFWRLLLAFW